MRPLLFAGAPALLLAMGGVAMSDRPAPPKEYKFVENTDRWVEVIHGKWRLSGQLDKGGEFTQVFRVLRDAPPAMMPPAELLNGPGQVAAAPVKAYELRHGTLIPGELRKNGPFVPEVGGTVIKFADYRYSPEGPQIWNLPGRFVPVEPPAKP